LNYCTGQVVNCTIAYNSAYKGGGLFNCEGGVNNCIIWGNEPDQLYYGSHPPTLSFSCIEGGAAGEGNIDQDPLFVDPNGGNFHLRADSPCVNSGCSAFSVWPGVDIDGHPRIVYGQVDMGADEYAIVDSPGEGEAWCGGSVREIKWPSWEGTNVDILVSIDEGANWELVEADVVDIGSYTWAIPELVDSDGCVIKITADSTDPNSVSVESGLFTIHPCSFGPAVESRWKSLGGDYRRTSSSEFAGPEYDCIEWEFEVDGAISGSVTVGPNDNVYVPCEDGNLYCLDSSGALLWTFEAGAPLISSASMGPDGTAYLGGADGKLRAVNRNGGLRWTYTTDGFIYSSPAVGPDGKIFVGSEDGRLYALAPDGSELWSFETAGFGVTEAAVLASPAIGADGTVYVGGLYDSNLYALEPNDGVTKWVRHFDSNGWCAASAVVGSDGTIYQVLVGDANLYAIDPNDGGIIWKTDLSKVYEDGGYYSDFFEPVSYAEVNHPSVNMNACEYLYYGSVDTPVLYNLSDSGFSEPALGADGMIYVNLDDPWLRAVEPNGAMKWASQLEVGEPIGQRRGIESDGGFGGRNLRGR